MKQIILYSTITATFICCNSPSKHESAVQEEYFKPPVVVRQDTIDNSDFHTTYTDVIENLFVFINKKDWKTVSDFYMQPDKNTSFFKDLMNSQNLSQLELLNILKRGERVYVITKATKKDGSEVPMCFLFDIEQNRVADQVNTGCGE